MQQVTNAYRQDDLNGREYFSADYGKYFITAGTEDDYDRTDIYATAITNTTRTYIIEVKAYCKKEHPRAYAKFIKDGIDYGYQIDYEKIEYLIDKWRETGRIPILYVRFLDLTIVWDLRDVADVYEGRRKWKWVNADGQNYGKKKEFKLQTYLYKKEAKIVKENTEKTIFS